MTINDIQLSEWHLIRHAPVQNARKGIYSNADDEAQLPDQDIIRDQASRLPDNALWFVSPLLRTKQTADALRNEMKLPGDIFYLDELKEQNFGDWQGLSFEDIWQKIKNLPAHNWSLLTADNAPPNGESFLDVQSRVSDFIEQNIKVNIDRPRIMVTHAGVIRSFIGLTLELDSNKALSLEVSPFSLSQLTHQTGEGKGGQWQLNALNRTCESNQHER